MPASPYFLFVTSNPTTVSPPVWKEFYTTEHLPDLIKTKTATRAAFYEEVAFIPKTESSSSGNPHKFLAAYQTDHKDALQASQETDGAVRSTSELFAKESGKDNVFENGDFDARNYELIQEYDPNGIGEQPSPEILTVEMNPKDPADFDAWYRSEHLDLLAKMPGYRRTLRYKISALTPLSKGDTVATYLAIHEVDNVAATFGSKESVASSSTPWTKKQMEESTIFVARAWKRLHDEGF